MKNNLLRFHQKGYLKQCLYPMVYLGQMKVYEYSIEKKDVEAFFATLDFNKWKVDKTKSSLNISFNLVVFYEDNEVVKDFGFINQKMPKEYYEFEKIYLN